MLLFPFGDSIEHDVRTTGIIQKQSTLDCEETSAKLTKVYLVTKFSLRVIMSILQNLVVMLSENLMG